MMRRTDALPLGPLAGAGLGEAAWILRRARAVLHPAVMALVLSGSRGPRGGARRDSDIDVSLLVYPRALAAVPQPAGLLRQVTLTTLRSWKSTVELDLAVVLDTSGCGLGCFLRDGRPCGRTAPLVNCFGVYKLQKGFHGYVTGIDLAIEKVRPMVTAWIASGELNAD